jgi:hypothetical protein
MTHEFEVLLGKLKHHNPVVLSARLGMLEMFLPILLATEGQDLMLQQMFIAALRAIPSVKENLNDPHLMFCERATAIMMYHHLQATNAMKKEGKDPVTLLIDRSEYERKTGEKLPNNDDGLVQ